MSKDTFGLHFGALCDSIKKQVKDQGFEIDDNKANHFDKDAEAITRLGIRLNLADSVKIKLRQRLLKNVVKEIKPVNK